MAWISFWWGYIATRLFAPIGALFEIRLHAFDVIILTASLFVSMYLVSCMKRLAKGEYRQEFVFGRNLREYLICLTPFLIVMILFSLSFFLYYEAMTYPFRDVSSMDGLGDYAARMAFIERFNSETIFAPWELGPGGGVGMTPEFFIREVGYLDFRLQAVVIFCWFATPIVLVVTLSRPRLGRIYIDLDALKSRSWTVIIAVIMLLCVNYVGYLVEIFLLPLIGRLPI